MSDKSDDDQQSTFEDEGNIINKSIEVVKKSVAAMPEASVEETPVPEEPVTEERKPTT